MRYSLCVAMMMFVCGVYAQSFEGYFLGKVSARNKASLDEAKKLVKELKFFDEVSSSNSIWNCIHEYPADERNVAFSLYVERLQDKKIIYDYYRRYNELPWLMAYYMQSENFDAFGVAPWLEALLEESLVDKYMQEKHKHALYGKSDGAFYWKKYAQYLVRKFPDNHTIKRILVLYALSPACSDSYFEEDLLPLIKSDEVMGGFYSVFGGKIVHRVK